MSSPSVAKLEPVRQLGVTNPISIKLTTDLVKQLRSCAEQGLNARLIVKDGIYVSIARTFLEVE